MTNAATPLPSAEGRVLSQSAGGTMRTCVLVDGAGRTVGEGVAFADGRTVIHRGGGARMERYLTVAEMAADYNGQAVVVWCDGKGCSSECAPRQFVFERATDVTGVSGTGVVVEGVQFTSGQVAMVWLGELSSLVFWSDIQMALTVHGHSGATVLRWLEG